MKKFLRSKKGLALLAALVVAVAASVGAYAYFTDTGSGTGSATVGSSSQFTVYGDVSNLSDLYPGDGVGVTVPITVKNNGSGYQKAGTVTLDSITADSDHASCDTSLNTAGSAFTFANPLTIDEDLAPGATSTEHDGTLYMNDTGVSQDSCQGAVLTLNFSEHNAS